MSPRRRNCRKAQNLAAFRPSNQLFTGLTRPRLHALSKGDQALLNEFISLLDNIEPRLISENMAWRVT